MDIILASSSTARRKQLCELNLDFKTVSPNIDETPFYNENPEELVTRLAKEKVLAIKAEPNTLIIGGDQVCILNDKITGKPKNVEHAIKQLQASSGQTLRFYSGLSVFNTRTNIIDTVMVPTDVTFRNLSLDEITSFVKKTNPVNCAGSFNVEGLGITLFEKIISDDPSALIGLPLIQLTSLLKEHGVRLP